MTHPKNHRVMIVDDDIDAQEALADILAHFGYEVIVVGNGQEALDRLRAQGAPRPCLIILDVMMPVMDGWQFRDEQRKDPELASIPVIFATADLRAQHTAADAGGVAFIPKPIQIRDLMAAVRAAC